MPFSTITYSFEYSSKKMVRKKENMKYDEPLRMAKINAESDNRLTWRCASKLRNDIFAVQSKQVCEPVTFDNI